MALKSVATPEAEIVTKLFSFLKKIRAIHGKNVRKLFETYVRWVRAGEKSTAVQEWNKGISKFECPWYSSQEAQDAMLLAAGARPPDQSTAKDPFSVEFETCKGSLHSLVRCLPILNAFSYVQYYECYTCILPHRFLRMCRAIFSQ